MKVNARVNVYLRVNSKAIIVIECCKDCFNFTGPGYSSLSGFPNSVVESDLSKENVLHYILL